MIKVCKCCSNVDIDKLETIAPKEQVEVGCIENCAAYEDKAYGIIDDEMIVANDSDDFIEIVKNR